MLQFFKFLLASIIGFIIGLFLLFFILIGLASSISSGDEVKIKQNSVLEINLDYPMLERSVNDPFAELEIPGFGSASGPGLEDVIKSIKNAKTNNNIKGILIRTAIFPAQFSQAEEIRDALIDFKESGKFIYAYGEVYTQKAFYLASVADSIYMNPTGMMEFKGFSSQPMFFAGLLEKLDIEAQIIKVGDFKSAAEPFVRKNLSDYNRLQMTELLNSIYDNFIGDIATARNIDNVVLRDIANEMKVRMPEDAVTHGLVDALRYEDEVFATIRMNLGLEADKEINFISLKKFNKAPVKIEGGLAKDRIAVLYATGQIVDSESSGEEFLGSKSFVKAIREAANDDKVKAIVLRVNSPGGSALASDVMTRELRLAKAKKPFIVSMSGVAASGGYYIAALADTIVAEESTITGSIGVIGMIPNFKGFFNNKLGITFDVVKTAKHADYLNSFNRALTDEEKFIVQSQVNRIYEDFTKIVAEGRGISQDSVKVLGGGRVYSGSDALKLGLVDVLGNLDDAIKIAAEKAGITEYRIKNLPEVLDPLEEMLKGMSNSAQMLSKNTELNSIIQNISKIERMTGVQTITPYSFDIK